MDNENKQPFELVERASQLLRTRLGRAASHHAHQALTSYQNSQPTDFYLHAGMALELAIKARLAGHSVFLLAPQKPDWFRHGMKFITSPDAPGDQRPQSVSARDALERLKALEPALPVVFGERVAETLERRNKVVHLGLADAPPMEELLSSAASFVRAIDTLLLIDPSDFWGVLEHLAEELVAEELNAVGVAVAAAIARARTRFGALDLLARSSLQEAAIQSIDEDPAADVVPTSCPACGSRARASGELILRERDEDGHEHFSLWGEDVSEGFVTLVHRLTCQVCGLDLNDEDSLVAAMVPTEIANVAANEAGLTLDELLAPLPSSDGYNV